MGMGSGSWMGGAPTPGSGSGPAGGITSGCGPGSGSGFGSGFGPGPGSGTGGVTANFLAADGIGNKWDAAGEARDAWACFGRPTGVMSSES